MLTKEEKLEAVLNTVDDVDVINWWNDCCSDDDTIHYMDELDYYCRNWSATEIIDNTEDFHTNDDYFVENIYGLESFSDIYDIVDNTELINYMIDNDEDFGSEDVREILDEDDDEEE